jgi:hypothetical protein
MWIGSLSQAVSSAGCTDRMVVLASRAGLDDAAGPEAAP